MNNPNDFYNLEQRIAAARPLLPAPAGLGLQIMRQARKQSRQRSARAQIMTAVSVCLLLFLFSEIQFRTYQASQSAPTSQQVLYTQKSHFPVLEVEGADIGHWSHVEALLSCRQQVQEFLPIF